MGIMNFVPTLFQRSEKRTNEARLRLLISLGIVFTILLLSIGTVSAANSTDVNTTVSTSTTGVVAVPTTQPLDVITTITTQTQNIIAALITPVPTAPAVITQIPTIVPTSSVPALTTPVAAPTLDISATSTQLIRAGNSVNGQFNVHAGKRIPQSEKLAAAADYQKMRDAYLLQNNGAAETSGFQTAGYSISAVAPTMDVLVLSHGFLLSPGISQSITCANGEPSAWTRMTTRIRAPKRHRPLPAPLRRSL